MVRYSFTVQTPRTTHSVAFGPNHHIGAVLGEILARDEVGWFSQDYDLVYEGTPLDLYTTVAASPLEDGAELYLNVNPSGGI